jgi:hypothetical protein
MLINIVVTTMAADPAVAFKPGDYLVSVGFRLRHGHPTMRKYMRIKIFVNMKCAIICATQRASRAAWYPCCFTREPSAHLMPCIGHRFGSLEHTGIGNQAQESQQATPGQTDARRAIELLIEPLARSFMLRG